MGVDPRFASLSKNFPACKSANGYSRCRLCLNSLSSPVTSAVTTVVLIPLLRAVGGGGWLGGCVHGVVWVCRAMCWLQ